VFDNFWNRRHSLCSLLPLMLLADLLNSVNLIIPHNKPSISANLKLCISNSTNYKHCILLRSIFSCGPCSKLTNSLKHNFAVSGFLIKLYRLFKNLFKIPYIFEAMNSSVGCSYLEISVKLSSF